MRLALTLASRPEATPEDEARIRYAMSIVEPALVNMVADYQLPADLTLEELPEPTPRGQ